MPAETEVAGGKKNWAEQMNDDELVEVVDTLPPIEEQYDEATGMKKLIEYKYNEEGKKVRIVRTYKVEKTKVPKKIAQRKKWAKFGDAFGEPDGPNPSNTTMCEETNINFVHLKEQQLRANQGGDDSSKSMKASNMVTCRYCKGDHWTLKCPYKDKLSQMQEVLSEKPSDAPSTSEPQSAAGPSAGGTGGKYVPPYKRSGSGGEKRVSDIMPQRRDNEATVRVSNLSEDVKETDLQELFSPFGQIMRIYLHRDKVTGLAKGFAFITFRKKEDAERAIAGVSGYGYDHLILTVQWARPPGQQDH